MKYLYLGFLLSLTTTIKAQSPKEKIPKDSILYYRKELNQLWQNTYDSLKTSARYNELQNKIDPKNRVKRITIELLANIGLYFNDFENLNTRLSSIGQKNINGMVPSLGGSLAIGNPILTYGFEFSGYAFDNNTATFKGMHGKFYIAKDLFKKGRFALHPQIGYAGSYLKMFIHKSQSQVNFNDLFTTQANTIYLSHSQDYLDVALGIKLKSLGNNPFYWQFFRAGYRYGLKNTEWKMAGGDIINAPADRNNQFYLQVCLGFDK